MDRTARGLSYLATGWVNVMKYGAVGDFEGDSNTATDNSDAFQAAMDEAAEKSLPIYLPPGRYMITRGLKLYQCERPNTAATMGKGIGIIGSGMYTSGIIFTGDGYAVSSDYDMAETFVAKDFYINHANGGGIHLPQGCHQIFERYFSAACADTYYGIYIEGNLMNGQSQTGYGSYVTSISECRFWGEEGYGGQGVLLEDILLCAKIDSCFFSTQLVDKPHLHLKNCHAVDITNSAFERREVGQYQTSGLIHLESSANISIRGSHAEPFYEAFVTIKDSFNVNIDGIRADMYALQPWDMSMGYAIKIMDDSDPLHTYNISLQRYENIHSNHEAVPTGNMIYDPLGVVKVDNFKDRTPFQNLNSGHQWRFVSRIGDTAANLVVNPSLWAVGPALMPVSWSSPAGIWSFEQQSPYYGGCRVKQTDLTPDVPYKLNFRTAEALDKYPFYTIILQGINHAGISSAVYFDLNAPGQNEPMQFYIPKEEEMFTFATKVTKTGGRDHSLVIYGPMDMTILNLYIQPFDSPYPNYGSELLTGAYLDIGRKIFFSDGKPPYDPEQTWPYLPGEIALNMNAERGQHWGYKFLPGADGWIGLGKVGSGNNSAGSFADRQTLTMTLGPNDFGYTFWDFDVYKLFYWDGYYWNEPGVGRNSGAGSLPKATFGMGNRDQRPTNLGAADVGFHFYAFDTTYEYIWDGGHWNRPGFGRDD